MVDIDTYLTTLYVMVDDYCKTLPLVRHPGPASALSRSEVITLGIFSQWWQVQRRFYRWAERHLRAAFPGLPQRSQFNRALRRHWTSLVAFSQALAALLTPKSALYQVLDCTGLPVRNAKRRGRSWFAGQADIGWSLRLGWYFGFHLLTAVTDGAVITGWGFGSASSKDQPLAEVFLALRSQPQPAYACVGAWTHLPYLADAGFAGVERQRHWLADYQACVISPPQSNSHQPWPEPLHRWHNNLRQIVETVNDKLQNVFRLQYRRSHALDGLHATLAAVAALHNFCLWLNAQLGRPHLAFADLIDW